MANRQRVLLSKELVDLVGARSRVTGETITSILEDLILNENNKWLKESCDNDREKEVGTQG